MSVWSAIKYAMNSSLGKGDLFAPIDEIVRGGVQTFVSNGTFTVPRGVTKIYITACGGGGGGAGDAAVVNGGSGADFIVRKAYKVTPKQKIQVTVGKGGTGGGKAGQNGTATVIGNLITLAGGLGGTINSEGIRTPGSGNGGYGGYGCSADSEQALGDSGQSSSCAPGGTAMVLSGSSSYPSYNGGGGGASLGRGGDGGYHRKSDSKSATAGLQGGGGGGDYDVGGKGGDGIVIIEW